MKLEIIEKKREYDWYEEDVSDGCSYVDFKVLFHNVKNKREFEDTVYALTEAIANTVRDFEKAFTLGQEEKGK